MLARLAVLLCLFWGNWVYADSVLAVHQGLSSFYHATGAGACGFEPSPDDLMVAAVNSHDYDNGTLCGVYLRVSGPKGEALVRVVDRCPGCKSKGLDLSKQAFAKVADPKKGRETIHWQVASPDLDGPLQYHFKAGSTPHWLGIQLRNHRNPIAKLEVQTPDGGWVNIERTAHNYFVHKDPKIGNGPYTFRVTDVYGNSVIDKNIPLRPGVEVASAAQLPDAAEAAHLASAGGRWLSEDEADNMVEPLPGAGRWEAPAEGKHAKRKVAAKQDEKPHAGRWVETQNPSALDNEMSRQQQAVAPAPAPSKKVAQKPAKPHGRWTESTDRVDVVAAAEAARWVSEAPAVETEEIDTEQPRWSDGQVAPHAADLNKVVEESAVPPVPPVDVKPVAASANLDDLVKQQKN